MEETIRTKLICAMVVTLGITSAHATSVQTGGDDFDDNSVDPAKWVPFVQEGTAGFTETNQRLEYRTTSTGESFIEWKWNGSGLSYTQDWSIAMDTSVLYASGELAGKAVYMGLAAHANGYVFDLEHTAEQSGHAFSTYVGDPLDSALFNEWHGYIGSPETTLKISFDAQTKMLYSSYSIGGNFIALTNYSAIGFGMTDSSLFTPSIWVASDAMIVPSGKVHFDNFRIYEPIAAPNQTISSGSGEVVVGFNTVSGLYYELWASTNLVDQTWEGPLHTTSGSNNVHQVSVSVVGYPVRYFQIRGFEMTPEAVAFQSQVVGTFLPNTATYFTSPTRFIWDGVEPGDWSYTKTGLNTALLIFTYDEDGNDPSIYREEIIFTYTGKDTGSFRYSEFNGNVEDPASVSTGPFTFN